MKYEVIGKRCGWDTFDYSTLKKVLNILKDWKTKQKHCDDVLNNSGKDKGSYWNRNVSGNEYQLELTFKPTIDSGMKGEYIVDVDKEIKYVEELMKHLPIEDEGIERFI